MSIIDSSCEAPESYSNYFIHNCTYEELNSLEAFVKSNPDSKDYTDVRKIFHLLPLVWKVLGNLTYLLEYKVKNDSNIDPTVLKFIVDTIQFIKTGRRDIGIQGWKSMLRIPNEENRYSGELRSKQDIKEAIKKCNFNVDKRDMVILWCSKENGLQDMLCTISILLEDTYNRESGRPLNDSRIHVKF